MRHEIRLPDLGEGLDEAEVVQWLVRPGQHVGREQAVIEVQTDKATVELPSPVAGVVVECHGAVGERFKVGTVLAVLETEVPAAGAGADPSTYTRESRGGGAIDPADSRMHVGTVASTVPQPGSPTSTLDSLAAGPAASSGPEPGPRPARPMAAPSVRALAVELGVDLATVTGSGPNGRILADDVRSHSQPTSPIVSAPIVSAPTASQPGTRVPLRGIRRRTAELMAQSWTEVPHITVMDEIDATALLATRASLRAESAELQSTLTPGVFFVAAVARAMRRFPDANASIDLAAGEILVHGAVDVGLAVAAPQGLVVPVVRDAGGATLAELAATVSALTNRARAGSLSPVDLAGGTVTVTNYGSIGGRFATPLVKPPQSVIVGFGAVAPRPIVVDGAVVARPTLPVVVSADHRLIDGQLASSVLMAVCELLTEPVRLLVR